MLHFTLVTEGAPSRFMIFLHGLFGQGSNLRSLARRFVAARPEWGVALVDLRMHGRSQGLPPPHTIDSAAADLEPLAAALPAPLAGVLGHSLGGKVALAFVARRGGDLDRAIIVDAWPGARGAPRDASDTERVMRLLESLPARFSTRADFVARVTPGAGRFVAEWLAQSLVRAGDELRFGLDLGALRDLLEDYRRRDLLPVVEALPGRVHLDLVIGARSPVWPAAERERLADRAAAQARLSVHLLPAGHFVHIDDPDGLLGVLAGPR